MKKYKFIVLYSMDITKGYETIYVKDSHKDVNYIESLVRDYLKLFLNIDFTEIKVLLVTGFAFKELDITLAREESIKNLYEKKEK